MVLPKSFPLPSQEQDNLSVHQCPWWKAGAEKKKKVFYITSLDHLEMQKLQLLMK